MPPFERADRSGENYRRRCDRIIVSSGARLTFPIFGNANCCRSNATARFTPFYETAAVATESGSHTMREGDFDGRRGELEAPREGAD